MTNTLEVEIPLSKLLVILLHTQLKLKGLQVDNLSLQVKLQSVEIKLTLQEDKLLLVVKRLLEVKQPLTQQHIKQLLIQQLNQLSLEDKQLLVVKDLYITNHIQFQQLIIN